jgi:predicted nucleic acid-binding protein
MTEVIVPDASVILKWAFRSPDEHDSDKALLFLNAWIDGKVDIILPKLWSFEVGNVLMLKKAEFALEIMEIFLGYNFAELDMTYELCKETFNIMKKHKVTFYDAVYHAVAIIKRGKLLTADESYYRKVNAMSDVIRLKDWHA